MRLFIAAVAAASLAVAAPALAAPATAQVRIDNFTFAPATLTARAGATVTWMNQDDIPHAVVANDHAFNSHVLDTGDRFAFTFARPGVYPYFCSLHPHMVAKVVVTP